MMTRELQAAPNWSGASASPQAVWQFPFTWKPVAVCLTLTTDATVGDRFVQFAVSTPESQVAFSMHVGQAVPASTIRNVCLADGIQAVSDNAAAQNLQAPLPGLPVLQNMAFRIAIVDLEAGDRVTAVRLYYERLD